MHGAELVSFSLIVGEATKIQVAKSEHVTPLEKSVLALAEGLQQIQSPSVLALAEGLQQIQAEQEYMRMRERAHRNTMESTKCEPLHPNR
ncbi:hypothetical protein T484DRAFT_1842134 [Baffinella frigidus]|nr:hypothetical protein T484DRAFT_1842134 [Cryptophyta sp. CCMP2293]